MSRAPRIYISGPMTGVPGHNHTAFNEAAKLLQDEGWDVVNPADVGSIAGFKWGDYVRFGLTKLVSCTDIYLLSGWELSRGASLEHHIAATLGLRRHFAPGASTLTPGPDTQASPDRYRIDSARYQDVCRLLSRLSPGWDEAGGPDDTGLACQAIRQLSGRDSWAPVRELLHELAPGWADPDLDEAAAARQVIEALLQDRSELKGFPGGDLVVDVLAELERTQHTPAAKAVTPLRCLVMAGEAGNLTQAVLGRPVAQVRKAAIQTAAAALRLAMDGDPSVDFWRASRGLDKLSIDKAPGRA